MENDRYYTWTGIYLGGTLGMYLAINYRGFKKPLWWVLGALGYGVAYLQGPRDYSKSPQFLRAMEDLETNYGAL